MKTKFITFLESLKGKGHDTLIESVKEGFSICYENMESTTKYTCPGCGNVASDTGNAMCSGCVSKTDGAQ